MAVGSECIQAAAPLLVKRDSRDLLPSHPTPGRGLPSLSPWQRGSFPWNKQGGKDIRRNWETLKCLSQAVVPQVGSALLNM